MDSIIFPIELKKMAAIFFKSGYQVYLVGGAVRDIFLSKKATDWDIATNATPQQVMQLFKKVIPTGIEHGTVTVLFMNKKIEVTTFRSEQYYSDGRHPDTVIYTATIEEDLSRRDFTMNAIAISIPDGKIIDPFGGRTDITKKYIRTVGPPEERFTEDGLRPIRALRFSVQLGFILDPALLKAISSTLHVIAKISIERFRDEFTKILSAQKPSDALQLMEKTGILMLFIPELQHCRGIKQGEMHHFDVLDHLFYSCDGAPKNNLIVRLSALFHDIGKPQAQELLLQSVENKSSPFYNHEKVSAEIAGKVLERLRFPKNVIHQIIHLIKQHMFHYEENWTDAAVRRFLVQTGADALENLLDLRLADIYGMTTSPVSSDMLLSFRKRIEKIQSQDMVLTLRDLTITGNDLIKIGIPKGKIIGIILNELMETVIDNPEINQKEKLLNTAEKFYKKRI